MILVGMTFFKIYIDLGIFGFFYHNWGLFFAAVGETFIFISAGIHVVEDKLIHGRKKKSVTVKSTLWMEAQAFFELGLIYAITNLIVFWAYMRETDVAFYMKRDEDYDSTNSSTMRQIYIHIVIIAPPVLMIVEFLLNKIIIKNTHFVMILILNIALPVALTLYELVKGEPVHTQFYTGEDLNKLSIH